MLLGRVARMYYEHGLTHQEIATALGLSRVRVTRLLAEARDSGLVEIIVHVDDELFGEEEQALVNRFGLIQAWISPSVADGEKAAKSLGAVGAGGLINLIEKDSIVALSLSSAVARVVEEIPSRHIGASFVPVTGSSSGLVHGSNPHELALTMAARTGGRAFHLPSPLLAASGEAATSMYNDPGVREVLELAAQADVLIAGLGGMTQGQGILLNSIAPDERSELIDGGAVGDIAGRFFTAAGKPVQGKLDARLVGLRLDQLLAIRLRLGVAYGPTKVEALRAALENKLVNILVTDSDTARALLSS